MIEQTGFDTIAPAYDTAFNESLIGREQRLETRRWLNHLVSGEKKLHVLEINCGTGDDALWLASLGHHVIATDQSAIMIRQAEQKRRMHKQEQVQFLTCPFSKLSETFDGHRFDLVFSNFAGLNCVPPKEMPALGKELYSLVNNDGYLAAVIFGKHSLWETVFFLLKRKPVKAFRRWQGNKVMAKLDEGNFQPVYYYSTRRFMKLLSPFRLVEKKPVGLFIPPSYMEQAMKKRPGLFRKLVNLESRTANTSFTSDWADHTYVLLKKEES